MNWTGGNLQRHSKNKNKAITQRQKSHFAKVRSSHQHKTHTSEHDCYCRSPSHPLSVSTPRHPRNTQRRRLPSPRSQLIRGVRSEHVYDHDAPPDEVQVRVGSRAFASQLNTTNATTPSINPPIVRTASVSSSLMLFDQSCPSQSDQELISPSTPDPLLDSSLREDYSQTHRLIELPTNKVQGREGLSSGFSASQNRLCLSRDDPSTEAAREGGPEDISECRSIFSDIDLSKAAAIRQSVRSTSVEADTYNTDHDNHGDFAWRLIQDGQSTRVPANSALHFIPDTLGWTRPISQYPSSDDQSQSRVYWPRSSLSQSPLLTHLACYTELKPAKQTEIGPLSKSNSDLEDEMWRKFVFGSGDTTCRDTCII